MMFKSSSLLAGIALLLASLPLSSCESIRGGGSSYESPEIYGEVKVEGRIYVAGTEAGMAFIESKRAFDGVKTRTLVGGGPEGETVVIETQVESDALADSLQAEFERRHFKKPEAPSEEGEGDGGR
jgi:predicted small secreted protein